MEDFESAEELLEEVRNVSNNVCISYSKKKFSKANNYQKIFILFIIHSKNRFISLFSF